MDQALLELLQGIQRKLESLDNKVSAVQATQAAQGQGLADVQRGLDELRLLVPAHPPQGAPAAAAAAATRAAAATGQRATQPLGESGAEAHGAGQLPDDAEMPDAAAAQPEPIAQGLAHPAAGVLAAERMQRCDGGAQPTGEGRLTAASPAAGPSRGAAASAGQPPWQGRRRLEPQRLSPQPQPPGAEAGEAAAEQAAVGAGQGPFPAVESFRPDEVLKEHEDFIVAALPRRPPGRSKRLRFGCAVQGCVSQAALPSPRLPICTWNWLAVLTGGLPCRRFHNCAAAPYRRGLPARLWLQAGLEPPPEAAGAAQQQLQQQQQPGRPPGWPSSFMINSQEVCGPCHPVE